jgi:prepilin-type N-terminal cleavage/methylation domain-containing protein
MLLENNKNCRLDRGFTILELIAVMAISTVIFSAVYIVLSMWSLRFEQLSRIAILNEKAYDCIMTMKHGLAVEEDNSNRYQFLGLTNANKVSLSGNNETAQTEAGEYISGSSGVVFKPPKNQTVQSAQDSVVISLNRRGYVEFNAFVFGIDSYQTRNVQIFPKHDNSNMFVDKLVFSKVPDPYAAQDLNNHYIDMVRIYIKAGVHLSDGENKLFNPYPDPYYVEYETFIAIEQGIE